MTVAALNSALHLIILSSEQCNFRCSYCYEKFERYNISDDVLTGIDCVLASRLPHLSRFDVGWFGGEPLLNIRAIEYVGESIRRNANAACQISGSVSTNATLLTQEVIHRLRTSYITSYQISIDGPQRFHDTTRLTKKGKGSFEQVIGAVRLLADVEFDVNVRLRIHVTKDNCSSMEELFSLLATFIGGDTKFHLHIKAVEPLGSSNDSTFGFLDNYSHIASLQKIAETYGLNLGESEGSACYAAMPNSFVIRTDGAVLKCTVALDNPKNIVGSMTRSGMEIDSRRLVPWISPFMIDDVEAMKCPAHKVFTSVAASE